MCSVTHHIALLAVSQILDQRLQEHEQMALNKFAELNQRLSEHPLLQVLHQ